MSFNDVIVEFLNSYAKPPQLTEKELAELSKEELIKLFDWLVDLVKLNTVEATATQIFQKLGGVLGAEHFKTVELYTHPDDNNINFSKLFVVDELWLIEKLIEVDKNSERKGVVLQNFLDNCDFDEAAVIYERAKEEGKIISEVELSIKKEHIVHGLRHGYIKLTNLKALTVPAEADFTKEPDETVCQIGDSWFYFGGTTAEGMNPNEYRAVVPFEDIVSEIFTVLESFRQDEYSRDEYMYYETYLREMRETVAFVKLIP